MEEINFAILAPLVAISLLLVVIALVDLVKRPQTNGPKLVWALVILFITTLGPIVYFVFGRKDG
ncbi:PLDc_N domain-containing protein [Jeotgalibacillus sp. S-D1]|uniref:PLD nuclease N-terminal domain-containing protein n=1 Tax=Jeotgalibacillus sp. S-D1 TaxID=2552189 RepID=UPI00105A6CF9|nr:PLD nuclease N-terminal domain-containing protein [Jeotgalibacillus sp. S-D1]TDL32073.1 PLDc_N domain-containing protein [Jeotgalibacillus sp. S-D1]